MNFRGIPLRHSVLRRVALTTGSAALAALGGLASGVMTARMLAPDSRGVLAILITTVTLGALVGGLGSNVSLRVYLPRDSRVTLVVFGRLSVWLSAIQVATLVGAIFVLTGLAGIRMSLIDVLITVGPFGIAAFGVSQVLDSLNAVGKTSLSALTNAVGTWLTSFVLLIGLILNLGLTYVLVAYTLGFVARLVFGFVHIRRTREIHAKASGPGGGVLLIKKGAKLLGLNLGQSLTFRLDQYALALFSTVQGLGQYAVAVAPASIVQVFSNSIGQVAMRDAATSTLSKRRLFGYVLLTIGGTSTYAVFMVIAAPWLIPFVFGDDYRQAVEIVQILVVAEIALSPYLVLSKVAAGVGRLWLSSSSGLVGLLVMIVTLPGLVITFGPAGAAWGCVVTYSVMSLFASVGMVLGSKSTSSPRTGAEH